jgi:hypothetical protein
MRYSLATIAGLASKNIRRFDSKAIATDFVMSVNIARVGYFVEALALVCLVVCEEVLYLNAQDLGHKEKGELLFKHEFTKRLDIAAWLYKLCVMKEIRAI